MTQFTIVLVIHIFLCIAALRRIWHAQNEEGTGWQVAWSFVVLLTPLVGPVMYFGMAMPPPEKPESDRMGGLGIIGNFTGLYDSVVSKKPTPPTPPKNPPGGGSGDTRAGAAAAKPADVKSDLAREVEEARRMEEQERDRQRQEQT